MFINRNVTAEHHFYLEDKIYPTGQFKHFRDIGLNKLFLPLPVLFPPNRECSKRVNVKAVCFSI